VKNPVSSCARNRWSSKLVEDDNALTTVSRSVMVKACLHDVGTAWIFLQPCNVRCTRAELHEMRTSGKYGSSWWQMLDK